jgi:hypothetical protein
MGSARLGMMEAVSIVESFPVSTNVPVQIIPVETVEQKQQFIDLPWTVYQADRNWVPPLKSDVAKKFVASNPFFQYGRLQQFLAVRDGQAIGRIVAAVNDRLIEKEQQQVGLFGFFECVDEVSVAAGLFEAAGQWLRQQGMTAVRGPIDLSTHNSCLFLVDGFDTPPMVMMPYNPAYYAKFMEQLGWQKAKDAYAYDFPLDGKLSPEFEKGYQIALKAGITFRPIQIKGAGFEKDCISLYNLFTKAFEYNWSSTPRTQAEFLEEAKSLQSLVDPDVFPVAEYNGEMVGFWMGLPDYNIALQKVNGRLNLPGILKFLWYKRQINQGRVIAIASLPEFRRKMVPLGLIYLGMRGGQLKGKPYKRAELSWVYEDNYPSRKLIEASGGKIYKTYRIYEKSL